MGHDWNLRSSEEASERRVCAHSKRTRRVVSANAKVAPDVRSDDGHFGARQASRARNHGLWWFGHEDVISSRFVKHVPSLAAARPRLHSPALVGPTTERMFLPKKLPSYPRPPQHNCPSIIDDDNVVRARPSPGTPP